jgi:hypothetical protein
VRNGEGRHRHGHAPPVLDEDHERKDKQQMVEAEQDVLHAEAQIGRCDFSRAGRRLNGEGCPRRRKSLGLYCAGKAFDPNQNIR